MVALQALSAYAQHNYSPNVNVTLRVQNGEAKQLFNVNTQNAIVLQSYEVCVKNLVNS